MKEKTEIVINKSKIKLTLKSFFISFCLSFFILFGVCLFGEIDFTDLNTRKVYLETSLSDMPYFGIKETYNLGYDSNIEPILCNEYIKFNENVDYGQISGKIENIQLYKLTNYYLPYILLINLFPLLCLTFLIMILRYLITSIRNKFSVKLK